MNQKELEARIAELEGKLAQATKPRSLTLKVSEKGGISMYGVNSRFPITLYANQWERVLDHANEVRAFIKANQGKLSVKP